MIPTKGRVFFNQGSGLVARLEASNGAVSTWDQMNG